MYVLVYGGRSYEFCPYLDPGLDLEIEEDTVAVDLAARGGEGQVQLALVDPAKGQGLHHQASQKVGQGHHRVNLGADLHREMDNRMTNLHPEVQLMIESKT